MAKIIIKHVLISILSTALFFGMFLLWMNAVNYYDLLSVFIVTIPMALIVRILDDYIRDIIIILRDNKTVLATIITGVLIFGSFIGAYFLYTEVLNSQDIFVTVFDFLEKYVKLTGIRDMFGIY